LTTSADLALWEAELVADPRVMASSLAVRLAEVPDPRDPRGRRHPLVVILSSFAVLAVGRWWVVTRRMAWGCVIAG